MLKAEWGVTRQRFLKYPWAGSPYSLCLSASRYIVSRGSQAVSPCSSGAISRAQNMSAAVRTLQHQPSFVFTHGRLGFCASISLENPMVLFPLQTIVRVSSVGACLHPVIIVTPILTVIVPLMVTLPAPGACLLQGADTAVSAI